MFFKPDCYLFEVYFMAEKLLMAGVVGMLRGIGRTESARLGSTSRAPPWVPLRRRRRLCGRA